MPVVKMIDGEPWIFKGIGSLTSVMYAIKQLRRYHTKEGKILETKIYDSNNGEKELYIRWKNK